jgi:mono/diheme cytochrome c family protein
MSGLLKKGLLGVIGISALLGAVTALRQKRTFAAPYPEISASTDPTVIERGRYLAQGPAHCSDCHGAERVAPGQPAPLSGGHEFNMPFGVVRVPNITPDAETGISRYSDREIARMLRYGVRPDGTLMLPFMPFADLSDTDLTAVISYLRSQAPLRHAVKPHEPNLLGRVALAFVIEPQGPSEPPRKDLPAAATAEYGKYLANSVANCVGCHTERDLKTGAFTGPRFGGGGIVDSHSDSSRKFVTPNLTPDYRWGWISNWSEDAFVHRLKAGKLYADSPMPWPSFASMTDDDLRAVYRYLRTLPAAKSGPDPRKPGSVRLDAEGPGARVSSL